MNCPRACGSCCKSIILPIKTDDVDYLKWLTMHKGVEVKGKEVKIWVKCKNLKRGKCRIYDDRPLMCRSYDCKGKDDWYNNKGRKALRSDLNA